MRDTRGIGWLELINSRAKGLFEAFTSFKNLLGILTIVLFFIFDHADTMWVTILVIMLIAFREGKELLAIWVKHGNQT